MQQGAAEGTSSGLGMASTSRLEGKVAIVTGGASGIGESAVRLFASHGATVIIADIQDDLGSAVAASVDGGAKCSYVHCDITDEKQVEALVSHAVAAHGRLDVLFSNAGAMPAPPWGVLDMDIAELDRVMAVNVRGVACTVKHAARAMVAGGTRGSIVCTASVAAAVGGLSGAAYTASKHVAEAVVLKPRHVAEAALFFASDESAFVTGHNLVVDGGFTVSPINIL